MHTALMIVAAASIAMMAVACSKQASAPASAPASSAAATMEASSPAASAAASAPAASAAASSAAASAAASAPASSAAAKFHQTFCLMQSPRLSYESRGFLLPGGSFFTREPDSLLKHLISQWIRPEAADSGRHTDGRERSLESHRPDRIRS